jgi:hypothetical protein
MRVAEGVQSTDGFLRSRDDLNRTSLAAEFVFLAFAAVPRSEKEGTCVVRQ